MLTVVWSRNDDAWTAELSTKKFPELQVYVLTDGETMQPTAAQQRSLKLIEELSKSGLPRLTKLARKYAVEYLGPEEADDMEAEDLAIEIHSAFVPRLRDASDRYIIFVGSSDIDIEHGVAVLCKNGDSFAVTHSDIAYATRAWDDVAELDQLLGG